MAAGQAHTQEIHEERSQLKVIKEEKKAAKEHAMHRMTGQMLSHSADLSMTARDVGVITGRITYRAKRCKSNA